MGNTAVMNHERTRKVKLNTKHKRQDYQNKTGS